MMTIHPLLTSFILTPSKTYVTIRNEGYINNCFYSAVQYEIVEMRYFLIIGIPLAIYAGTFFVLDLLFDIFYNFPDKDSFSWRLTNLVVPALPAAGAIKVMLMLIVTQRKGQPR